MQHSFLLNFADFYNTEIEIKLPLNGERGGVQFLNVKLDPPTPVKFNFEGMETKTTQLVRLKYIFIAPIQDGSLKHILTSTHNNENLG